MAMKQRQRSTRHSGIAYESLESKNPSDEETELFVRKPQYKEIPTIDIEVTTDDSLQALSVRYQCPVFELKRLNNIHTENEIFARKTIKVPLKPFSLTLPNVHGSGSSSPKENLITLSSIEEIDPNVLNSKLANQLLITADSSGSNKSVSHVNEVIFNSNIKPSIKNCDSVVDTPIGNELVEEECVSLLPISVLPKEAVVTKISCSGAGSDISWIQLIILVVVLIVAVPLIIIFYIYEHPEKYHHENS